MHPAGQTTGVADVTKISLILFDLNGVLYHYDRAARINHLASVSNRAPGLLQTIWDSGFEDAGDAGTLDADDYLRGFGDRIGYPLSEAEWVAAQQAALSPIAATVALLPRIASDVACAVLTNNNLLVQRHFATLYPAAAAHVGARAYVSASFNARKPDPEVYRRCLSHLGVEPPRALFIDDSAANVAGAVEAGLSGHHYTTPHELESDLRRRGLLIQYPA